MPGLNDLASLLGMEEPEQTSTSKKTGYDGNQVVLKVRIETRRGKKLTCITGFQSSPKELSALLQTLKKKLGTGGQVTDNAIEIQGEHAERVEATLVSEGYKIKKK